MKNIKTNGAKMRSVLAIALVAIIGFSFAACDDEEEKEPTIEFLSVTADGSTTQTTTQLTLTFDKQVTLTGVTLSGVPGVIQGDLKDGSGQDLGIGGGSGTVFILPISGFTSEGILSVTPSSFSTITGSPKTVTIYYYGGGFNFTTVSDAKFGASERIRAVAYGNGKFVAVGYGITTGTTWAGKVAYSTDGVTWTAVTDTKISGTINCIAYGSNKFVAGGDDGLMAYSSDGITWTKVTSSGFATQTTSGGVTTKGEDIRTITWGNNKFVAGGRYGAMSYSSDGTTWTGITKNNSTFVDSLTNGERIYGIVWGNDKFVAVGDKDNSSTYTTNGRIAYSSAGTSWAQLTGTDGILGSSITAITYGGGKFVACNSYNVTGYSTNGTTWTTATSSFGSNINAIIFADNKYVAVGSNGKMAFSSNAITWTTITSPFGTSQIYGIAYGGGKFVAVADGKIAYSGGN